MLFRSNPKPYSGAYYISGANTNNNRKYGDPDKTSASSEGSSETSSDSAPSDTNSAPTFLGDSPSHSGDKAAPTASNIKGRVVKVICDIKG